MAFAVGSSPHPELYVAFQGRIPGVQQRGRGSILSFYINKSPWYLFSTGAQKSKIFRVPLAETCTKGRDEMILKHLLDVQLLGPT